AVQVSLRNAAEGCRIAALQRAPEIRSPALVAGDHGCSQRSNKSPVGTRPAEIAPFETAPEETAPPQGERDFPLQGRQPLVLRKPRLLSGRLEGRPPERTFPH